nr:F56 [uncultured bacterium]
MYEIFNEAHWWLSLLLTLAWTGVVLAAPRSYAGWDDRNGWSMRAQ